MAATISNPVVTAQLSSHIVAGPLAGDVVLQYRSPTITIGTSAGQIDREYSRDFTVDAGTPLDIDLTAITDPSGAAISFGHITHVMLANKSTTPGQDMTLGGAASNPVFAALPTVARANGGSLMINDPNPGIVIDGTHKNLRITVAAGTGVAGSLLIWGRSV